MIQWYSIRTKDPNNHSDTETGTLSTQPRTFTHIIHATTHDNVRICTHVLYSHMSSICSGTFTLHTSYLQNISNRRSKCPSWPPSHLQGRRWNFSWNARPALLQMDPSRPRYYFASSSKFASTSNGPLRTELIFCLFSLGSPNHLLANKLEKYLNRNIPNILKEYLESN